MKKITYSAFNHTMNENENYTKKRIKNENGTSLKTTCSFKKFRWCWTWGTSGSSAKQLESLLGSHMNKNKMQMFTMHPELKRGLF